MQQVTQYPNWFAHYAQEWFGIYLAPLRAHRGALRFLQVGAFTGDASVWLLEQFPNATLVDVDTWEGSDEPEHEPFDFTDVERTYDQRLAPYRKAARLLKYKGNSDSYFAHASWPFDFIYIDGSHTAAAAYRDGANAVQLLKPGGLIAFDDYLWKSGKGPEHDPGPGIDRVAAKYRNSLDPIASGLQCWFRRA